VTEAHQQPVEARATLPVAFERAYLDELARPELLEHEGPGAERLAVGGILLPTCDVDGAVDVLRQDVDTADHGQERSEGFRRRERDGVVVDHLDACDAVSNPVVVLLRTLDDAYLGEAPAW